MIELAFLRAAPWREERNPDHQTLSESEADGVQGPQPKMDKTSNQRDLEKGHCNKRWSMVSSSWSQGRQIALSLSPLRNRRSPVQHRSGRANQANTLCFKKLKDGYICYFCMNDYPKVRSNLCHHLIAKPTSIKFILLFENSYTQHYFPKLEFEVKGLNVYSKLRSQS